MQRIVTNNAHANKNALNLVVLSGNHQNAFPFLVQHDQLSRNYRHILALIKSTKT